ncbi:MAG: cell division protein FtsZ [Saprospiraceae bacterium]
MIFELLKSEAPIIKVIGVGGGGSNAVNHMFRQGIVGVDFAICNTDAQAIEISPVSTKIQLGPNLTEGRGAGSKPNIGKLACEESVEELRRYMENNCKMLFITAGMGGGTGTGAAPIIAKTAQELDILTVGIVTVPFFFEGKRRSLQAIEGLDELKKNVDTLIVISNDKLRQIHGNLSITDAFAQADNVLTTAAKGIAEIITVPGYVNVDFEDVNTVMRNSGVAIMGTGMAEGENRAKRAVDEALNSPLLEDSNIRGAQHILLNITSGSQEVTMDEIFEITEFVQEEAGHGTDLIWGNCYDENLGDALAVTVIATGFDREKTVIAKEEKPERVVVGLDDDQNNQKTQNSFMEDSSGSYGSGNTIEFDNLNESIRNINKARNPNFFEPHVKNEEMAKAEMDRKKAQEEEFRRKEMMRNNQKNHTNPKTVAELEKIPAYLRRNVRLDKVEDSSESKLSKWTISEGDEPQMKDNNTFLHDNVD